MAADISEATDNERIPDGKGPADGKETEQLVQVKHGRAIRAVLIATSLLIGIFVTLNLPYKYASLNQVGNITLAFDYPVMESELPTMAGAPFRYLIRYENDPRGTKFSWSALLLNLSVCMAVILLTGVYTYRKKIRQRTKGRGNLTIADLMIATMLVASFFGWYQYLEAQRKSVVKYVNDMAGKGHGASYSAWLPELIAGYCPETLSKLFIKVRGVRMESPELEDLHNALAIKTLTKFRLGGANFDLREFDPLATLYHLDDLRLAGMELDQRVAQAIASRSKLRTLNLIRTNVTSEIIGSFDLPVLQRLNLMHTDVKLAKLTDPKWSNSIVELTLPHPSSSADELTLTGWPQLKLLEINDWDVQPNSNPVEVVLSNLPQLETIRLDLFQCFGLTLSNLPELQTIEPISMHASQRLARGDSFPRSLWLARLLVDEAPELAHVDFHAGDLQSLKLVRTPAFKQLNVDLGRWRTTDEHELVSLSQDAKNAIVQGLSESDGPEIVDLDEVDLSGVDISAIKQNERLKEIRAVSTGIDLKQIRQLGPNPQLRHLRIDSKFSQANTLPGLLNLFPDLEVLECAQGNYQTMGYESIGDLRLVGHENLRELKSDSLQGGYCDSVFIADMPQLKSGFDFGWVGAFHLEGSPALERLVFKSPLPDTFELSGVKTLQVFAAGGDRVDDSVLETILECSELTTLTLAYASASAEQLAKLKLGNIVNLSLPGCNINDEVVKAWGELPNLQSLDLSGTDITANALASLLKSTSIQSLRLDGCNLVPQDLVAVAKMPTLRHLSISGIGLDETTLSKVVAFQTISRLSLSGTKISNAMLDSLTSANLELLVLRDCELDSRKLLELTQRNSRVMIDPTGSNLDPNVHTRLMSQQRVIDEHEFAQFKAMRQWQQAMSNNPVVFTMPPEYEQGVGEEYALIDTDAFSPDGEYNQPDNLNDGSEISTQTNGSIMGRFLGSFFGTQPAVIDVGEDATAPEYDTGDVDAVSAEVVDRAEGEAE
ncbi:hypothetical protein LOC67_03115 [Stieleria sp. JC731]|uniref:hypothetical protein n=1 Tax=Pirellulaceae TaxID=2691357 RepID=UPI001E4BFAE6|nr:hypothetical protein [Stieleria sp. JC731]MCC9599537.1 hypothetical protein [Stieleria sp. JC731]